MNTVTSTGGLESIYSELIFSKFFVFEEREPYFQETLVQIIWNECLVHEAATLADGRPLKIVHPGVWNLEAGPDFKDAAIFVGTDAARGNVEIHIRPADWRAHGHHNDPAYRDVALHVVWDNPAGYEAFPPGTPLLVLKGQTQQPLEKIIETYNITNYPYSQQVQPVSWAACLADMKDDRLIDLLHSYGIARVLQKARLAGEFIQKWGLNVAAYRLICDALGYKNNREQFSELVDLLPLDDMDGLDLDARIALIFGAAGLLPDPCTLEVIPHLKPLLSRLWSDWWPHRREYREIRWNRRQRPYNAPERRLLSLALLLNTCGNRPGERIVECFTQAATPKDTLLGLRQTFVLDSDQWRCFYRFDKELEKGAALMGASRVDDFIVNVAIPLYFAWCFIQGDSAACFHGRNVLLSMGKLDANRAFKEAVAHLIVPPSRASVVLTDACAQQGLLKLYRSFFELSPS